MEPTDQRPNPASFSIREKNCGRTSERHFRAICSDPIEPDPKEGGPRSWKAGAVFMAIPPRLVLPPLISWEPSLPAELAEAAKATPTWMGETTKV